MTARPLLLLGAGGMAREVLAAVRTMPTSWRPIGVLDDDPSRHGADLDGVAVLGGLDAVADHPDAAVVLCVASPRRPGIRLSLRERLSLSDDRYATVVHPAASVPAGTELGVGSVFLACAVITTPLAVGAHVIAMPHVLITHDDEVADCVTFAGRAALAGGVRVGEGAYFGQGSMVRESCSIGPGAVIGMGAVVLDDVPAGEIWAGVPARKIGQCEEEHS